ncbi:MAG: hypothetical protein RR410_01090, partial [Alistipes sp.]
ANAQSRQIEEASEIDPLWLQGAASVGICGATSTPTYLMQEVADAVGKIKNCISPGKATPYDAHF